MGKYGQYLQLGKWDSGKWDKLGIRRASRITGNYYRFINTPFRPGSLGRLRLTSILLLLSIDFSLYDSKNVHKGLEGPAEAPGDVGGPWGRPWILLPLAVKCRALCDPSWSGITAHALWKWGQGFHPLPSERTCCLAPSVQQCSENLGRILFCRDVGAGKPGAKWGWCWDFWKSL